MTRLSSSLLFDAKAKVRPLMYVSVTAEGASRLL